VLLGIALKGGRPLWGDVLAGARLLQRRGFGERVELEAVPS
jgi:hypothetical protein